MTLSPGQVSTRGVAMGAGISAFPISSMDLFGTPDPTFVDVKRSDRGLLSGAGSEGGRQVQVVAWLNAWPETTELLADRARLAAAWRPQGGEDQLIFCLDEDQLTYFGQCRGADFVMGDNGEGTDVWEVTCDFMASDPRPFYDEVSVTINATPTTISNTGAEPGIWRYTVGPCVHPVLTIGSWVLSFPALTVPSGKTMVVSSRRRSVTIGGLDRSGYAMNGSKPAILIQLPPGNSAVSHTASSGATTADFTYRLTP